MSDTMTREQRHYCMSRIRGKEVAALGRVQIFVAFQKAAGMSGHRAEEVPYCDIHKRVFLARASRMRQVQDASVECGVLAGEDPAEQGEGRAGSGGS